MQRQYLLEHVKDPRVRKEWAHHHKEINNPSPLEDQLRWLREIGFRQVAVPYTNFTTVLYVGKK